MHGKPLNTLIVLEMKLNISEDKNKCISTPARTYSISGLNFQLRKLPYLATGTLKALFRLEKKKYLDHFSK